MNRVVFTFVFVAGLLLPLLFATVAIVLVALRPIFVALFCSVERFEREYGKAAGR